MADDSSGTGPQQQGRAIMVSFHELISINKQLANINAKVDTALTLPVKLQDHEDRLVRLETERAVRSAKGGVYGKAWEIIFGLVLALIAAGVWWPKVH